MQLQVSNQCFGSWSFYPDLNQTFIPESGSGSVKKMTKNCKYYTSKKNLISYFALSTLDTDQGKYTDSADPDPQHCTKPTKLAVPIGAPRQELLQFPRNNALEKNCCSRYQCCGSGSVMDPYSGASWIRIRIRNTDPHMQIQIKNNGGKRCNI